MKNKKQDAKRLVIYLLLAFGIAWIPEIILNRTLGYENYFGGAFTLLTLPLLYACALGNLLTRKLTKEGFSDPLLHFRFKGNLKYYALAVLFPVIQGISESLMFTALYGHFDWNEIAERFTWEKFIGQALILLATGPLFAWNTIGEEYGWRGYMNQKMEPLLGTTGTVLIGGVLWGVWHAPLTLEGHNFGKDYAGYPYAGILAMCINCVVMGVFLMWLTKKTNSIFPAAILHACNNAGVGTIGNIFLSGVGDPEKFAASLTPMQRMTGIIPMGVLAVILLLGMTKAQKQDPPAKPHAS